MSSGRVDHSRETQGFEPVERFTPMPGVCPDVHRVGGKGRSASRCRRAFAERKVALKPDRCQGEDAIMIRVISSRKATRRETASYGE
jgi:hypothetical protein